MVRYCPACSTEIKDSSIDTCPVCLTPLSFPLSRCQFCGSYKEPVLYFELSSNRFALYLYSILFVFFGYLYYKNHLWELLCPVCGKKRGVFNPQLMAESKELDNIVRGAKLVENANKVKALIFISSSILVFISGLILFIIGLFTGVFGRGSLYFYLFALAFVLLGIVLLLNASSIKRRGVIEKLKFLEKGVLIKSKDNGGVVTVMDLCSWFGLNPKEGEELLNNMALRSGVSVDIGERGEIVYKFDNSLVFEELELESELTSSEDNREKTIKNQ